MIYNEVMTTYEHEGLLSRLESFKEDYENKIKGLFRATPINEHENVLDMIEQYIVEPFEELPSDMYKWISASYKNETTEHYEALGLVEQEHFDQTWFTRQLELKLELKYYEDFINIKGE